MVLVRIGSPYVCVLSSQQPSTPDLHVWRFDRSIVNYSPWYNRHGWLGVKKQLSIVNDTETTNECVIFLIFLEVEFQVMMCLTHTHTKNKQTNKQTNKHQHTPHRWISATHHCDSKDGGTKDVGIQERVSGFGAVAHAYQKLSRSGHEEESRQHLQQGRTFFFFFCVPP